LNLKIAPVGIPETERDPEVTLVPELKYIPFRIDPPPITVFIDIVSKFIVL
jgi:hypothetical protein